MKVCLPGSDYLQDPIVGFNIWWGLTWQWGGSHGKLNCTILVVELISETFTRLKVDLGVTAAGPRASKIWGEGTLKELAVAAAWTRGHLGHAFQCPLSTNYCLSISRMLEKLWNFIAFAEWALGDGVGGRSFLVFWVQTLISVLGMVSFYPFWKWFQKNRT